MLQKASVDEEIFFARFSYGDKGTEIEEEGKKILQMVPSQDKTKFSLTVRPLSKDAEGTYSCGLAIGGVLYISKGWDTSIPPPVEIYTEYTSYYSSSDNMQLVECDGEADENASIKYKHNDDVIYDTKNPAQKGKFTKLIN